MNRMRYGGWTRIANIQTPEHVAKGLLAQNQGNRFVTMVWAGQWWGGYPNLEQWYAGPLTCGREGAGPVSNPVYHLAGIPRVAPRGYVGAPAAGSTPQQIAADATTQIATVGAAFTTAATGSAPSSAQLSSAGAGIVALQNDLNALGGSPAPGALMAAGGMAPAIGIFAVGGIVGTLIGYMIDKRQRRS
jgi:hypothetical protein